MGLVGCFLVVGVAFVSAQQGQDFFFNGAGQHPRYLAYQQPSLQTQQQLSSFFSPQTNSAFDPFRTSQQSSQRNEFQPIQPAQFQFPPSRSSSLQQFEQFTSRPTQFVHTNQHLPQPFQHFDSSQDTSSIFGGVSLGHSNRFQNLPNIQKPTFQSQFENAFIGIQNSEDETGRTTQSYVNVQHPKGVDQFPSNRWKQVQSSLSAPPVSETRKPKRPGITRPTTEEQDDDLALNGFVDQNLDTDEGLPRAAASSSPIDIFSKFQDKKREETNSRRKVTNKVEPASTETPIKFRKNPDFPRGTPAIPKTTAKPEVGTELPFRITTLRSKYNALRIKPTTYTPPSPASLIDRRQKNRTGVTNNSERSRFNQQTNTRFSPTSTERSEEIINIRDYSSEFGRPVDKSKTLPSASPSPQFSFKTLPDPKINRFNIKEDGDRLNLDHEQTHKFAEDEDAVDYEYSSDLSDDISGPGDAYVEVEETPLSNEPISNSQVASKLSDKKLNGERNTSFDVLTMSHDHVLVSDENFRDFVDSGSIDLSEQPQTEPAIEEHSETAVTIKPVSPVNKTIPLARNPKQQQKDSDSVNPTERPLTSHSDQVKAPPSAESPKAGEEEEEEHPTESWVIVASVQTSRSVSGARFLPGSILQQESPKPLGSKSPSLKENLSDTKQKENITSSVTTQVNATSKELHNNSNVTPQIVSISQTDTKSNEPVSQSLTHSIPSTESIIDKLDRVQSELSSGILSGGFRPLEVLPDMASENSTLSLSSTSTTTTTTTTTSTTTTTTTTTPEPTTGGSPPVVIRKFNPSNRRTTARPKPSPKPGVTKKPSIIDSIQFDDLTGLLPPGFKVRNSFKPKNGITTTTTESNSEMQGDEPSKTNSSRIGSGRSNDSSGLPNKIKTADISGLLPSGFKPSTESTPKKPKGIESILSKVTFQDVSALLPPGYKPNKTSESEEGKSKTPKVPAISFNLPSNLLPPGYKPKEEDSSALKPEKIDISALLPPGYKLTTEEPKEASTLVLDSILNKVKFKDVSALLPPGFQSNNTISNSSTPASTADQTTTPSNGLKVVFPSRPGGGRKPPARSNSSSKSAGGIGPVQPKIQKGWPTRATTEFTGWPTVSTTPLSIEKILAAAKTASVENFTPSSSTSTTSTTTTTTTTTAAPTTPGVCSHDCDLAATIKLVGGAAWVPELLDHNTQEWQTLANEVRDQLESVYSSSEALSRWYKKITIDAFSQGSVLVDYFVELTDLGRTVSTADMRRLFHEALQQTTVEQEALSGGDALKAHNTSEFKMGKFIVDPKFTDFVVLPKPVMPTVGMAEEDVLLPQWAIAVIVIGLASLLFVIIFGVTVLVNRHNSAKKKQPVALTEDMLNELNKNHMGGLDNYGADDLYNMEDVWNEKPTKKRSSGSLQENSMANLYDSWRSEWNGYYYNAAASGYYGGSSSGGYGPGRRRSDYDTNF